MDIQKVDLFLMLNSKYFENHQIPVLKEKLSQLDEEKWDELLSVQLHHPTMILMISLMGGQLGIDRFVLGETGLGIAKLLTCGGFMIWAIVDFFIIMGAARQKNMEKVNEILYM